MPKNLPQLALGKHIFDKIFLDGQPHFVYSLSVRFEQPESDFPLTLHIVKNQANFQQMRKAQYDYENAKKQLGESASYAGLSDAVLETLKLLWT